MRTHVPSRWNAGAMVPRRTLTGLLRAALGWSTLLVVVELAALADVTRPAGKSGDKPSSPPKTDTKREALFEGWPQPRLVLFITGRQNGYIEPCGCTGLENQKGGLMRRHTLMKQLTNDRRWPLVAVDGGNQVRRFGRQAEIKLRHTVDALRTMQYAAVAFGPDDLRLSSTELIQAITDEQGNPILFACANAVVFDESASQTYRVATAGKLKVGITSVLGSEEQSKIKNGDIHLESAEAGLTKVWPKLKQERCDLYVLLAHATLDESRKLAAKFPGFHVIVTTGGADEPAFQPEKVPGTESIIIQTGGKGMYAGVLGVFDSKPRFRYQRVPMDDRFQDSTEMTERFAKYQDELKTVGLRGLGILGNGGLGIRHPRGQKFVGSERCSDCHTQAFKIWKEGIAQFDEAGPHAHATQSLVAPPGRSQINRTFDPECLSCHVTGWNPQEHFPFESGYLNFASKELHANGCENCHGPGSGHVDAENGNGDKDLAARLRQEMRLTMEQAEETCQKCHDLDNSPDFHKKGAFDEFWKRIEHHGKD